MKEEIREAHDWLWRNFLLNDNVSEVGDNLVHITRVTLFDFISQVVFILFKLLSRFTLQCAHTPL